MIEARTKSGFRDAHFLAYTALLIAVGVLLPMIFHQIGIAGKIFLPMHFPVIIAGFLLGPLSGLLVGCFSPVLSFLLTGMPPFPLVLAMVPELMAYGAVSGWLHERLKLNVWIALPVAIVAGRVALGLAWWAMFQILDLPVPPVVFVIGGLVTGSPGIIGQLVLIPLLVRGIKRAW
jgi:predicted membrane protein